MTRPRRPPTVPRGPGFPALLPAAVAGLISGCAGDAGVLARVNREAITVARFHEAAAANPQAYPGPADSAKARLLEDLVTRNLMVQGALGERVEETPAFQAYRLAVERQVLRETLFQRLVAGPFPVSEGEIRELYARRDSATRVRLIFTFDETLARQAEKDLARGDAFAVVADRYNATGTVPAGGDAGFLRAGDLLPPLDDLVRTAAPGRVLGPVALGSEGWFLLRVEERRPQSQPPFDELRARLGEMIRQRKRRAHELRVLDRLRREYEVEVLPGGPQFMVEKLRTTPGGPSGLRTPPPPGPEDRERVLARYRGGTYTLGEAYDELLSGVGGQLDLAMLPSVRQWIESQALERTALAEARRRRVQEEPEVRRRIRDRLDEYLLNGYYQRHVIEHIRIEPEDHRQAYQRFRSSFERLRAARVISVTTGDSASAAVLAGEAGPVPDLGQAAATAGLGGRVVEEELTFPADSPLWTRLEHQLSNMRPGDLAGPFPVESGWLIVQLREKDQAAPAFENLPSETRGQLQGLAIEIKREARLAVLADSLRRVLGPILVDHDRLRRLPWPPAPAGRPGA